MSNTGVPDFSHPLSAHETERRLRIVRRRFSDLLDTEAYDRALPALFPFADTRPLKYVSDSAAKRTLEILRSQSRQVDTVLQDHEVALNHAIESLLREGSSWRDEDRIDANSPEALRKFDQVWHPEYQRYCEHIFNHLVRVPLETIGHSKGKDYGSMTLGNRTKRVRELGYPELTKGFNSIVRNSISHGTVRFSELGHVYVDRTDSRRLSANDFGRLLDDLVATCNGITTGVLLWISTRWSKPSAAEFSVLPVGFKRLLVQGAAEYPGFSIESVIEEEHVAGKPVLNVFCTTDTTSRGIHHMDSLMVASLFQEFGATDYSQFNVRLECGRLIPAFALLKAQPLSQLRREGLRRDLMEATFEGSLLWFDSPSVVRRVQLWAKLFRIALRDYREEVVRNWREAGLKVWGSRYEIKSVENKSAGRIRRLHAELVLTGEEPRQRDVVRGVMRHAVRRLRWRFIKGVGIEKRTALRRPPVYIWFRLHSSDRPTRSLGPDGWQSAEVLAQGEWRAWPRSKRPPVWVKQPDEKYRGVLIRYNPKHPVPEDAVTEH